MADVCLHPLIISRSEQQPRAYYFYTNICVISCDSPPSTAFSSFLTLFKNIPSRSTQTDKAPGATESHHRGFRAVRPCQGAQPCRSCSHLSCQHHSRTCIGIFAAFCSSLSNQVLSEMGLCPTTRCWQINEVDGCSFWAGVKQCLAKHQLVQKLLGCSNPNPHGSHFQPLHAVSSAAAVCFKCPTFCIFCRTQAAGVGSGSPSLTRAGVG